MCDKCVIGYWMPERKRQKFNIADFENVCESEGFQLKMVNVFALRVITRRNFAKFSSERAARDEVMFWITFDRWQTENTTCRRQYGLAKIILFFFLQLNAEIHVTGLAKLSFYCI